MKKIFTIMTIAMACSMPAGAQSNARLSQLDAKLSAVDVKHVGGDAPLIGITPCASTTSAVKAQYVEAVVRAGGVPVIIVADTTAEYLQSVVSRLDGVLLTGGVDVDPSYYNEEPVEQMGSIDDVRDVLELSVIDLCARRNMPVFGICRGLQMLNVAFGGTLYQDIPSQLAGGVEHRTLDGQTEATTHMVTVKAGSMLHKMWGIDSLCVNSYHHQGIKDVAKDANIDAVSADGIVEAIDFYPLRRIMAVQWHPERYDGHNDKMNVMLSRFVDEARLYRHAREVHAKVLSVDTHTDAPLEFEEGAELGKRSSNRVNVPKMREGMLDSQFLAAYVGSDMEVTVDGKTRDVARELNQATFDYCHQRVLKLINDTYRQVERYSDVCAIAQTDADVARLKAEGKKAFFIGVENAIGIGYDLGRLHELKRLGVKYVTLCHTYDNQVCNSSSHTADGSKGLTKFGRKVVKEMNDMGMIIDLSHASEGTFWDVMKLSKKPVVCTHSGARALCDHDRNITDAQLRALAQNGGVIQTVAYYDFLRSDGKATIEDFVKHLHYMVQVAGIDHVGIGTDFDGGGGVPGLQADNDMLNITMRLIEMGYSDEDLAKIWGGNFFRVMNAQ